MKRTHFLVPGNEQLGETKKRAGTFSLILTMLGHDIVLLLSSTMKGENVFLLIFNKKNILILIY